MRFDQNFSQLTDIFRLVGCKHNSGQELCYLCHQRQRRNVPISFTEEKEKAEQELDKALQQYQKFKDDQFYEQERVCWVLIL